MKDVNDVLLERGRLVEQMSALSAKEGFNAEDQAQWDKLNDAQKELKAQADRLQHEAELRNEVQGIAPRIAPAGSAPVSKRATAEYKAAFNEFLRKGKEFMGAEYRNALETGTNSEGGFITHEEFQTSVERAMVNYNPLRQYARVITTGGTHNIPFEATRGTASWTAEEAAYPESDPAFGRLVLGAHKLSRIVKVSEELVNDADFDLMGYLSDNFAEAFGLAEESAFVAGDGSGKPTGLTVVAGDVGSAEASLTEEAIEDLYWGLGAADRMNGVFIVNDASLRVISNLKDSDGVKIWQPGLAAGEPDTIKGKPYINSDYIGDPTSGTLCAYFGDLSKYIIADRTGMVVQRLDERYADTGQVGFRAYRRVDAGAAITSAHKSLTLA